MKYKGEKCAACGKVFTVDDDVVVCPECGSPHHRECYKAANKCANSDFHAEKKKWRPSVHVVPEKASDAEIKICPACRFPNFSNAETCARCGKKLSGESAAEEDTFQQGTDTAYGVLSSASTPMRIWAELHSKR